MDRPRCRGDAAGVCGWHCSGDNKWVVGSFWCLFLRGTLAKLPAPLSCVSAALPSLEAAGISTTGGGGTGERAAVGHVEAPVEEGAGKKDRDGGGAGVPQRQSAQG